MKIFLTSLFLLSATAWAADQDTKVETTEKAKPATVSQTQQPAEDTKQPQLTQNTQKFDDWSVTCLYENTLNENKEPTGKGNLRDCQATQIFQTADEQQIMRMYMLYEKNKDAVAKIPSLYFHVPVRAFLQPQVAIQIDQNKAIIVPYNFCDQGGCYAGGQLDGTVTGQFQKGTKAKIVFFNNERQPIALDLSLKGYTKAAQYLAEQSKKLGKAIDIPNQ